MTPKTAALTAACLLQALLVSGLWILLTLFAASMSEFDGHKWNPALVWALCAGPAIAGWLLVLTFVSGIWSQEIRARIARPWDISRLAIGFGSWFGLLGSAVLLVGALFGGASPDGWILMFGLAASSSVTLVGIMSKGEWTPSHV